MVHQFALVAEEQHLAVVGNFRSGKKMKYKSVVSGWVKVAITLSFFVAMNVRADTISIVEGSNSAMLDNTFGDTAGLDFTWTNPDIKDPGLQNSARIQPGGNSGSGEGGFCLNGLLGACAFTIKPKISGQSVRLDSFLLLSLTTNHAGSIAYAVRDVTTDALFASGTVTVGQVVISLAGGSGFTSANGFRIFFGPDGQRAGINAIAVTAVPLPAAAWLFLSALAGLVAIGRRRRLPAVVA